MIMQKKRHPKFNVPNFGAPNRKRVKERWRAQKGIDSKKRVKKAESGASPSIGYKNAPEVRFARPDGRFEVLIHNEGELRQFMGSKSSSVIRFAHDLSVRKRLQLQKIAETNKLEIANRVSI